MRTRVNNTNEHASRAVASENTSIQKSVQKFSPIAQLKTEIKHFTGKLNVLDEDRIVGKEMTASLDPKDPVVGSATGVNTEWMKSIRKSYPKANVVRGHLLNHDLGGFAIEENLYPISTKANSDHSTKVEQKVKAALTTADRDGGLVNYHVKVNELSGYEKAQFVCEWAAFDNTRSKIEGDQQTINSDLGTHVGGFGGWGKTAKSPVAWRHGKSKGGTEIDAVRNRVEEAKKSGRLQFLDEPLDHKGKGQDSAQDNIEFLNDLVDEYGVEAVYEALKGLRKKFIRKPLFRTITDWMNLLAQRPEMVVDFTKE